MCREVSRSMICRIRLCSSVNQAGLSELRQTTAITSSSQTMGTAISLLINSCMERWNPSPPCSSATWAMIFGCLDQAT